MKTLGDIFLTADVADLWLARAKRPITTGWVHCSASDRPEHDSALVMDRWHRERGWQGIGYHVFITKSGVLQYGRPWARIPATQQGHNDGAFAVCLHGLALERFTDAQQQALVALASALDQARISSDGAPLRWRGHCEVAAKLCPVVPYREWLSLDAEGYRAAGSSVAQQPAAQTRGDVLRLMDRGPRVKALQLALNRGGAFLQPDGLFGHATLREVREFQKASGLLADGMVGPLTIGKLRAAGLIGEVW